jgi:hypothetical protein
VEDLAETIFPRGGLLAPSLVPSVVGKDLEFLARACVHIRKSSIEARHKLRGQPAGTSTRQQRFQLRTLARPEEG